MAVKPQFKTIELEYNPKKLDFHFRVVKYLYNNEDFAKYYQYTNEYELISDSKFLAKFSLKSMKKLNLLKNIENISPIEIS